MANDLRWHIFQSMDGKPTEELLEIWQVNDRSTWSDQAFEVVAEILRQRLGELPAQNEMVTTAPYPVNQGSDDLEPSAKEPEFYRPKEVLWLQKQLKWVAIVSVVATLATEARSILVFLRVISSQNQESSPELIVNTLILMAVAVFTLVSAAVSYIALRWLASILGILMEMEHNSRPRRNHFD